MKKAEVLRDGLTILLKYQDCGVDAQHDTLYAGPEASQLSDTDAAKLRDLGWGLDETLDSWYLFT